MKQLLILITFLFSSISMMATDGWCATYYGDRYKTRRKTASGEWFDKNAMTCASMVHPFGTRIRVTNKDNGKSVVVKVTDRGQFSKRQLDLSYGAFGKIANHKLGRIKIKIEIL